MLRKRPARLNIGIDLDPEVIEHWQARTATNDDTGGIATYDDAGFQFHTGDSITFLQTYPFTGHELVYCDPPYVLSTRTGRQYRHEMTDAQHIALLDAIKVLPCMVMISGYWTRAICRGVARLARYELSGDDQRRTHGDGISLAQLPRTHSPA